MKNYLKVLRNLNNLTQSDVSNKIGFSSNYYCEIENRNRQKNISMVLIVKLAGVFGVPVAEIMESENSYKSKLIS